MTDLEEKLNDILDEKETKIIPGNIKKDVEIFDITGTYEGGGTVNWTDYYGNSVTGSTNAANARTAFVKLIKKIPVQLIPEGISLKYTFAGLENLVESPDIDMTNVTVMSNTFYLCKSLATVRLYDTSNVTNMNNTFGGCSSLVTMPAWNTSSVTIFASMFNNCSELVNVPIFNFSSATGEEAFNLMFSGCTKLSDTSLDNILQSCITVTNLYTGDKRFSTLLYDTANYPAARIQALPHYQDFVNAGWIIGY
jgi:hypothetical protein